METAFTQLSWPIKVSTVYDRPGSGPSYRWRLPPKLSQLICHSAKL